MREAQEEALEKLTEGLSGPILLTEGPITLITKEDRECRMYVKCVKHGGKVLFHGQVDELHVEVLPKSRLG